MRSCKTIHVISAHAEGEVGDVIVGGVLPPQGDTLWEQREFIAKDKTLRHFMLNEPRGGVFRHVNLLVPPKNPKADAGFIIMEPEDNPPMSGSNSMCVATVLLDSGLIAMEEPETRLTLEAPGGLVHVVAQCKDGKAQRITVENLPSFADKLDAKLDVPGLGDLRVDTAFGGDSFVIVDGADLGFRFQPDEARDMARLGVEITKSANDQLGFSHPHNSGWKHISFCLFADKLRETDTGFATKAAVTIQPGKIDRSPTGTALCARMAVLHAQNKMAVGDTLHVESIIGSQFDGKIVREDVIGDISGIVPQVSGRAWITGIHQHLLDPQDPWPQGYRINDTWGVG